MLHRLILNLTLLVIFGQAPFIRVKFKDVPTRKMFQLVIGFPFTSFLLLDQLHCCQEQNFVERVKKKLVEVTKHGIQNTRRATSSVVPDIAQYMSRKKDMALERRK